MVKIEADVRRRDWPLPFRPAIAIAFPASAEITEQELKAALLLSATSEPGSSSSALSQAGRAIAPK